MLITNSLIEYFHFQVSITLLITYKLQLLTYNYFYRCIIYNNNDAESILTLTKLVIRSHIINSILINYYNFKIELKCTRL